MAVAAVSAAQAQTIVDRQISNEPVETIVTRGPDGTTITRRPLGPGAVMAAPAPMLAPAPVLAPQPFVNPFAALFGVQPVTTVETIQTVEPAPVMTREVVRTPVFTREVVRPQVVTREVVRAVPARSSMRVAERRLSREARDAQAMAVMPSRREVLYRTVVQERPRPVITREVVGPPMPIAPRPVYTTFSTPPRVIGTTLAPDVEIYEAPRSPYGYTTVGDRVLLVDPATRVIVDDFRR